ncbi:MAG TPA: S26 family signal peptidase [Trebonia sp.]
MGLNGPIAPGDYVKRLIGLPGDRLTCCNAQGEISVNGVAINESQYLYPDDKPSQTPFSVKTSSAGSS